MSLYTEVQAARLNKACGGKMSARQMSSLLDAMQELVVKTIQQFSEVSMALDVDPDVEAKKTADNCVEAVIKYAKEGL